jgi:cytochrome c553
MRISFYHIQLALWFAIPLFLLSMHACQSGKEEQPEPAQVAVTDVNPNGSSELALLMREMHEAAVEAKAAIEQGMLPDMQIDFSSLNTATPTKPTMVDFEGYEALSASYITAMKALDDATDSASAAQAHTAVINTCLSCHQISCQGPIPRIKKLQLEAVPQ